MAGATLMSAQRYRRFLIFENDAPPTELVVARWEYTARGKFGGTGWSHNYPSSDQHFAQVISEATNIDVKNLSYRIVELGSPEVLITRLRWCLNRGRWRSRITKLTI